MTESPCVDVCSTDPENGLCVGCGRNLNEIANWLFFTEKQKKIVLQDLKRRNNMNK